MNHYQPTQLSCNRRLKTPPLLWGILMGLAMAASPLFALEYYLSDFEKKGNVADLGMITADGQSFLKVGLSPDLELGPITLGVDVRSYINLNGSTAQLADMTNIAVRKIGFTLDELVSLEYGRHRNIRYGYGLLMNQFRTDSGGSTNEFTHQKAGFKGWLQVDRVRIDGLGTGSNVYGGRVQFDCSDCDTLPLKIGSTYVIDNDGVSTIVQSNTITRPVQSGYSIDIGYPVFGDYVTLFSEYAKLTDQGAGYATGLLVDLFSIRMTAQFRGWTDRFVPSYFNESYESTTYSFDSNPVKADWGGLLGVSLGDEGDPYRVGIQWESFQSQHLLSGAVGWTDLFSTTGVVNYTYPLVAGGLPVINASLLANTNTPFQYIATLKRVYFAQGKYTDTVSVGVKIDASKFFSF